MKIGILTLPLRHNYGGILQAFALHTTLQRMGHETFFVFQEKKYRLPWWKYPLAYGKRILFRYILGRKSIHIFQEKNLEKQDTIIEQNISIFTSKYIEPYILRCDLKEMRKLLDAIVIGSDQIWRPKYYPNIERAYLDFAQKWDIKRIAYATSFGTDQWEYSPLQTRKCAGLIKQFNSISVREDSGVELCCKYFNVTAKHVIDPTLLLDKEDYIKIIKDSNVPRNSGTFLCYILDETQQIYELINKIAKEKDLIPFHVNSRADNTTIPLSERVQPSLESWLRGFYDAKYVITDSFHACVFAVIFNKPFIVLGNKERGLARFYSFLKMLRLEKQIISNPNDYNPSLFETIISTDILQQAKREAISFLHSNLNVNE